MFARFCIFSLILIGAATVLSVRAAGPGTHAPDRFTPDSARVANPDASARNQRLYDIGKEKEALYAKEEMTEADGMRATSASTTASSRKPAAAPCRACFTGCSS